MSQRFKGLVARTVASPTVGSPKPFWPAGSCSRHLFKLPKDSNSKKILFNGWIRGGNNVTKVQRAGSQNCRIADSRISKAILARWIVFKTFIQVAKGLELEED